MRTVEEFAKIVREENDKHNEKLLNMSPATLINRAWEIAKWQAIYDYIEERVLPCLEDEEGVFDGFLTLEINKPIVEIYEYEFNYDEPQWTTWDRLDNVVRDMFRAIKRSKQLKNKKGD